MVTLRDFEGMRVSAPASPLRGLCLGERKDGLSRRLKCAPRNTEHEPFRLIFTFLINIFVELLYHFRLVLPRTPWDDQEVNHGKLVNRLAPPFQKLAGTGVVSKRFSARRLTRSPRGWGRGKKALVRGSDHADPSMRRPQRRRRVAFVMRRRSRARPGGPRQ